VEFEIEHFEEIGSSFALVLKDYFHTIQQIERETITTNGWLKPKLLLEKTGIPAADLLYQEIEKKQREEKKKKSIEEYKLSLLGKNPSFNSGGAHQIAKLPLAII
jgi:hypothetical protein